MPAPRRAVALAALVTPFAIACAGRAEPRPRAASGVSLLDAPAPAATPFPTPAEWRYHPRDASPLGVRVALPDGSVLYAGQRGERWLVRPGAKVASAAAELAPEELVSAPPREHGFVFLGASGTSYESEDPLGPFVRSSTPLEPLVRVRAAGATLLGVRRDGALVRSDTALASFSRVGPTGVRFQDVVVRADGKGLALAVPEKLFETADFGASFTPSPLAPLGAEGLAEEESGAVVVLTALGPRRWDPAAEPALVPLGHAFQAERHALRVPLPLGPSASALSDGRAVVQGDLWLELRPAAAPQTFSLVTGKLGEPLTQAPFAPATGCAEVRLAGGARALYAVCARQKTPGAVQPLEIQRSADSGKTWAIEPYVVEGRTTELSMTVAVDGQLVISGVCPASLRGPGCRPVGVHRRGDVPGDSGTGIGLAPAATPSLSGTPLALASSFDGRTLYAIGRRSKSDALAVFVSHDAGMTFDARDVESLKVPDEDARRGSGVDVESSAAAEDGTVAFVVARGGRRSWLVVDEDGRALALAKPPVETARLGVAGQRGLAVDLASREAWESLDGGATFSPLGKLPLDPCPDTHNCAPALACVARGCVLGDVVSRIGWRAAPRSSPLPPPAAASSPRRPEPRVGATFSCTLDAGEWKRLPFAIAGPSGAPLPPAAEQAAIGRLAWFVLRRDPATAAVWTTHVRLGRDVVVEDITLLSPAKRASGMAYAWSPQIEGAAALRYVVPTDARDPNLRHVELAWDDALFGRVGHAILDDGGPFRPGDYGDKGTLRLAAPALVSIASGGLYVRLHQALGDEQPTYFFDGRSIETVPPVPWPLEVRKRGQAEMAHVGRSHVSLRIDAATVIVARRSERGWAFAAEALGLSDPKAFGRAQSTTIAYLGTDAGLSIETSDGQDAIGTLHPFSAEGGVFGEPLRVPTQLDLPTSPRACGARDKTATPRVVVPFLPGTRHAVVVTDPIEPMRVLLTGDAVLHGTPDAPCAAVYEAELVSSEASTLAQAEQGLVFVDPAEHSFLFRAPLAAREAVQVLEYRPMTCHVDPGAEVPLEVFREKGTLILPR